MSEIPLRAAVITVSDRVHRGVYEDKSGPAAQASLKELGFEIVATVVVPDEAPAITDALLTWSSKAELVVTTGGTGCAPRDLTPEATMPVLERLVPGIAEKMRIAGSTFEPRSWLSRGVSGLRGRCLIVNLPGSPKGVIESLDAVGMVLIHAIRLANGDTAH
ncbi:Molybdenum cofactor biosynthesis protein MoaB [Acidisarcina polymorpha]|uniref:Molybdopterin adenylyltransferase n=1 Tax=Acidisarcina polymorpha TaxID=2211140 RepID=A0A2Z5FS50_9BACT|nr:MogA/MoaB family molybdenum cofactor biosynthesis protein [Acidisarcina polymorpha]AXC09588.1 Molybdenum cofactor biosynthesis protein MoaB [Acidisarcina polymorpha]